MDQVPSQSAAVPVRGVSGSFDTCEVSWVPGHAFSAVFGAVIAQGADCRQAFQYFRPGFDLAAERQRRAEAGQPETFGEADLAAAVATRLSWMRR